MNLQPLLPILGTILMGLASWFKSRWDASNEQDPGRRATELVLDHYAELREGQKALQAEIRRLTERVVVLEGQISAKEKEIQDLKALTEDNTLLIQRLTDEREGLRKELDVTRRGLTELRAERDTAIIERDAARNRVVELSLGRATG